MSNDTREVIEDILEAAENLLGDGGAFAKAALRNAGYLWECPACETYTVKPDEDPVTCDECGKSSEPITAHEWQVAIRMENRIGTFYGYGATVDEALGEAARAPYSVGSLTATEADAIVEELEDNGVDRSRPDFTVFARRVVYVGPEDNPTRIGYIGYAHEEIRAYACRDHDDETGRDLGVHETDDEADQAIHEDYDTAGPFSRR